MKRLFPHANISTTDDPQHGDDGNCAWVASTDPLFGRVADAWMEIMIADFGALSHGTRHADRSDCSAV